MKPDSPSPDGWTACERWAVHEHLRQLKARYCRFIDTKQWERLRALFTADACFDGLGSAPSGAGVDAFIAGVSSRLEAAVSIHHCHTPELVRVGPDRVRGIWAMSDYLEWPQPVPNLHESPGCRGFQGWGHYEEEYRLEQHEWRICFLRLTRLRIDTFEETRLQSRQAGLPATANWL